VLKIIVYIKEDQTQTLRTYFKFLKFLVNSCYDLNFFKSSRVQRKQKKHESEDEKKK